MNFIKAFLIITKLTLCGLIILSKNALSCELVMGYRTSERPPHIGSAPDNNGVYSALYRQALSNINCKLSIVRAPKKRILKMLLEGEIDFYPGLGRSNEREQYLHFFENGLTSHTVALSHKDTADIYTMSEMKGEILLRAIGSNSFDTEQHNIHIRYAYDLTLASAIKLLESKHVDFYIYNESSLKYYLKNNPNENIKIHPCCSEPSAMFLGFSKKSKHAKSKTKLTFDIKKPDSTGDFLDKNSKAFQFKTELAKLKERGEITRIKQRFYQ